MFDLRLSPEQIEIRDTVRDFVARELKPRALDAHRLDAGDRSLLAAVLEQASRLGLRTLALPEETGGAGANTLTCCLVIEELAVGDADVAAVLAVTSALGGMLFRRMSEGQRARFLPEFLENDHYHLALARWEPGDDPALGPGYHRPAGIDRELATNAVRRDGAWVINGVKQSVANAPIAELFAVSARIEGHGAGIALVPRDTSGLSVHALAEGRPWYLGACGNLVLEDARVPLDNLLEEDVVPSIADWSDGPQFAALNLGVGRAACEAALAYAQLRVQGGRPIVEHQAIGAKLAEIAIRLDVARNAIWKAAWAAEHPEAGADHATFDLPLTTIARVFTAEAVLAAAKDAAECFGAMGVMRDLPLQKYVHDARICLHASPGIADAKLRIAEALAGYRRPSGSALAAE